MKKGISLIVLVITIIVMIILASSVVITLSNTGVIDRANEAVGATNASQVQDLAALLWADAYMENKRDDALRDYVVEELEKQGVTSADWNISVNNSGVTVENKNSNKGLGSLITAANYGDTVDYSVTVNGTTYSDWQIYYHNSDYVFLVLAGSIMNVELPETETVSSLTIEEVDLYNKFRVGNWPKYTLKDEVYLDGGSGPYEAYNNQATVWLIRNYSNFANKTEYGTYVEGAIGGPTVELLVEGWNSKNYSPKLVIEEGSTGYRVNEYNCIEVENDDVYVKDVTYWLASPSSDSEGTMFVAGNTWIATCGFNTQMAVRPIVCLKASIPVTTGTTTDFSLVK